jgi:hypothetical protein
VLLREITGHETTNALKAVTMANTSEKLIRLVIQKRDRYRHVSNTFTDVRCTVTGSVSLLLVIRGRDGLTVISSHIFSFSAMELVWNAMWRYLLAEGSEFSELRSCRSSWHEITRNGTAIKKLTANLCRQGLPQCRRIGEFPFSLQYRGRIETYWLNLLTRKRTTLTFKCP